MKKFFEQYGGVALGILALLVLIAMITPVGNIIKTSLQGTVTKFSGSINDQVNTAMFGAQEAQNSASGFETNLAPSPETPVVPGTPTPSPEPEAPVVPPVEPVTPENYDGYVTEPGTYFIDMLCRNQDQKPSGAIPFAQCLNYEINIYDGSRWTGWLDRPEKPSSSNSGDSEMVPFDITQKTLDENNGKVYLKWAIRAAMYGSVPIEEIGQPVRVRVGRIEADDSQTILKCTPYNGASTCS